MDDVKGNSPHGARQPAGWSAAATKIGEAFSTISYASVVSAGAFAVHIVLKARYRK